MTDIPNTSKSPYYLQRIENRPERNTGDTPVSQYSLRSIPAWDPNYLGSSLLAKRIRKTLAQVEQSINAVATGGVDYALLGQMVNDVLAGMNLEGLNEAQVKALIDAAVNALDSLNEAEVRALIDAAVTEFSDTLTAEVAAAIQALVDGGQLGTGGGGEIDEAAVQALIDASLAGVGPLIAQAVAAQAGRFENKLDLNRNTATDEPFVISVNNLIGAQWKAGVDFQTQRGEPVTVNGKRLLTEDDAVGGGGAVDTAAIIQAVVDYLETQGIGIDQATVEALIAAALVKPLSGPLNVTASVTAGVQGDTAEVVAFHPDNKPVNLDLQAPGGQVTVDGKSVPSIVEDVLVDSPRLITPLIIGAQIENPLKSVRGDLVLEAEGGGKVKVGDSRVMTEEDLMALGPSIGEAIQSSYKALPDKITLNVKSANATDKVTIEAWQLTPHPPTEARAVDVDVTPYGEGKLLVNGKRVLTVDDALEAGGGGIDQAALEAAVQAATADLRAEIDALKEQNKQLMVSLTQVTDPTLADVAGLNLPQVIQHVFNNVPDNQQIQVALDAKADKTELAKVDVKVQGTMDILGGRKDAALIHVEQGYQSLIDYVQNIEQWVNQTITDVIEYLTTEYATKADVENSIQGIAQLVTQLMQAIVGPGATPSPVEVAAYFTQLKAEIAEVGSHITEYVDEALQEKIPEILEALSTHLENTLAIFTTGGQPGQVVTPAQLTQLLADIARDYATKAQLDTTIGAVQTLLDNKAEATELAKYAKKDDGDQEITARVVTTRGLLFSISDEVLAPVDYDDYGTRLSILPKNATSVDDAGIVVVHTDLADLVPGATREIAPAAAPVWVPVTYTGGASGTVEARVLNGTVFFRGQLVKTHVGDPIHVFTLPAGIPAPPSLVDVAVPGEETGVAYRIASLQIRTDGRVFLIAPSKVTHTSVSDLSYLTEP